MKQFLLITAFFMIGVSLVAGAASRKKEDSIEEISRDAYVWGYPAVLMSHAKKAMLEKVQSHETPINHFVHAKKKPETFLGTLMPINPENLYSWAWVDLSKEPLVMTQPDFKDRFFSVYFVDAYANVFHTVSHESLKDKDKAVLLTPPGWEGNVPANVVQVRSSTPEALIIAQAFVRNNHELPSVYKVTSQRHLIPLSQWNNGVTVDPFKMNYPTESAFLNKNLASEESRFYENLQAVVAKNPPPTTTSKAEVDRFARLGLKDTAKLTQLLSDSESKLALERGIFEGERLIQNRIAMGFGAKVNGWSYELKAPAFTEDYSLRAAASQKSLFSIPASEILHLTLEADSEARQLSGGYRYMLHFEKDQMPPAQSMWALRVYEMKSKKQDGQPIASMNDQNISLKYNMDGSVDILVQTEKPQEAYIANWLPLPKDANFYVVLTLFNPHNSALNRSYIPPSLSRLDDGGIPKQRISRTMMAGPLEPVSK